MFLSFNCSAPLALITVQQANLGQSTKRDTRARFAIRLFCWLSNVSFISRYLSHLPEKVSVPWEKGCSFDNEVGQPLLDDVMRKRVFFSKE